MFRGTISLVRGSSVLVQKSLQCSPVLMNTVHTQQKALVASTEAKPERISKNLSFREAYDSEIDQCDRPLVLLYSWLVAKSKHIHKYSDFYMKKGYDVLNIKIDPMQLLRPTNAQRVVGQVVDFTQESHRQNQPILVHGFSVGGYLYGETLVKTLADNTIADNLQSRIRGQILDSPVSFDGIAFGVSRAVTQITIMQNLIQATIAAYLALTKNTTMKHFVNSQRTFEENFYRSPTLFLYSLKDVIGAPGPIEEVIAGMKAKGMEVYAKCFEESQHVGHFHRYPVEYVTMLTYFLHEIGMLSEPIKEKLKMMG